MINPKFSFQDKDGNEFAKANKLIVIWPTKNNISKFAGGNVYNEEHNINFEAMFISGHEKASEDYQISFSGLFGLYKTLDEAIAEADVCYGASDEKDLDSRKTVFRKVWNKKHTENKEMNK